MDKIKFFDLLLDSNPSEQNLQVIELSKESLERSKKHFLYRTALKYLRASLHLVPSETSEMLNTVLQYGYITNSICDWCMGNQGSEFTAAYSPVKGLEVFESAIEKVATYATKSWLYGDNVDKAIISDAIDGWAELKNLKKALSKAELSEQHSNDSNIELAISGKLNDFVDFIITELSSLLLKQE